MQRASSSCRTLSRYIMSRSLTIAPLITMISSPLMIPGNKILLWCQCSQICHMYVFIHPVV
jgi:hypothetical protein